MMKIWLITMALPLIIGGTAFAAPVNDGLAVSSESRQNLLGFKEWKKNQVFDARMNLDQFKSPQLSKMAETEEMVEPEGTDPQVEATSDLVENQGENPELAEASQAELNVDQKAEKLRQLEFNMEIAQGLTIHDYFALYLKNLSKEEMAVAIQQLSPDELSELLMAYRKALYGVPVPDEPSQTALQKNL